LTKNGLECLDVQAKGNLSLLAAILLLVSRHPEVRLPNLRQD
jgi:hypothetical protein